ncbi:zinc-binding loop region of homing endonuclease-domain-containing protein [Lipomyces chichibuensis]|uniref:zinc-binding loop region of homing endonuclease-domain-containing protein n=1 Tax=Lipomyces chichibuensis TaxID=1546026 RepID=UPI003343EA58
MDGQNLNHMTPARANRIIKSHHHRTTSLGCWESNAKPHYGGYPLVSVSQGGKAIRTGLHQLAVIADGRNDEFKKTKNGYSHDISHLCHNRRCFNAEHLVVESRENNARRKSCGGHRILVGDGFSYHPCAHGRVESMRKCILPVLHLEETSPNCEGQESTAYTPAADLDNIATEGNSVCTDRLDCITQMEAKVKVEGYRVATTELGCWLSKFKPDSVSGQCKATVKKVSRSLQQLAIIAYNRRDELQKALESGSPRGTYHCVSNLCHDSACFNPEHLIVESKSDNRKRKSCKGKTIIVYKGFTAHPCEHGSVDGLHKCILPAENRQDPLPNSEKNASTDTTTAPNPDDAATNDDGADAGTLTVLRL